MTKSLLSLAAFSLTLAVPAIAAAQQQPGNANCPPGSWFCADTQEKPSAPAGQPVQQLPAPESEQKPAPPPTHQQPPTVVYQPANPPPPVVVYQPPPPVYVHEAPPPPPYYYQPAPPWQRRREWGLNLHLEGAMIGKGVNGDAGMGGLGFGLRYKPIPYFGIEADLDFVGGRDYNSMRRNETGFSFNGLIFLNPKSHAQFYLLGGFGWSGAHVTDDQGSGASYDYAYFGGIAGFGLELRLARHFALNFDIRGFIRGRVDDNAQYQPEFRDAATGRTTNTSGGGLFTAGMTFYF